MRGIWGNIIVVGVTAALVSACSGGKRNVAGTTPRPPSPAGRAPVPPMGASAGMVIPAVGVDGKRITPNRHLSSAGTLWHVRAALNVAALSCNQQGGAARIGYNAMLKSHKTVLARANTALNAEFKADHGAKGVAVRDTLDTRVYNFFALPPVQPGFCSRAIAVVNRVNATKSADLAAYAPQALATLEEPFLQFFEAYAAYDVQMQAWRARDQQALNTRR